MFGIKPVKTVISLSILFLIFLASRQSPQDIKETQKPQAKALTHYMQKPATKKISPKNALEVLQYLFHTKVKDKSIQCTLKKGKTRYFIACKKGDFIKDNYWEVSIFNNELTLFARSRSSVSIINHYHFKELSCDTKQAKPEVEKAIIAFFR